MINPLTLTQARADGIECQDIELQKACEEALKSADDLILEHIEKEKYLQNQLDMSLSQNETLQKILLEKSETPWYLNKTNIFLLGVITGGVLTWKFSN